MNLFVLDNALVTRTPIRASAPGRNVRGPLTVVVLALWLAPAAATGPGQPLPHRDREFWLSLKRTEFAVPAGLHAADLLVEMNALLASPDPVLRDEVAYAAAAQWIIRDQAVSDEEMRRVMARWLENLEWGLDDRAEGDTVLLRSFSALCLSLVAARNLRSPFLTAAEQDEFLARTLRYFEAEKDVRGFDRDRGWIHSVAHTADVLKFLARSARLPPTAQGRILDAIAAKLLSIDEVLVWGEDDRIAAALQSVVKRADFDADTFDRWLSPWTGRYRELWATGPLIDPARFVRLQNARQVLRSLYVALASEASPEPGVAAATEAVRTTLAEMR